MYDIDSTAPAKPVANATRPKSAGSSSRASTSVLINPSPRVAMRQPTIQPAPLKILPWRETVTPAPGNG